VQLASDNVSYDGSDVFQADVTVKNLVAQPMGTPDGTTVTGLKVFFHSGPTVTGGTGSVTVSNADGTGTFTGSAQPYFEYDEILHTNDVSAAKTWQWSVSPTVTTFDFSVYVSTDIPVACSPKPAASMRAQLRSRSAFAAFRGRQASSSSVDTGSIEPFATRRRPANPPPGAHGRSPVKCGPRRQTSEPGSTAAIQAAR